MSPPRSWPRGPATGSLSTEPARWRHAHGELALDRCRVMAVVNVTPDSFYDGGRWIAEEHRRPNASVVLGQCRRWVRDGAELLDVGGESTRPGATPVAVDDELARVLPVIEALRADAELAAVPISIDTRRARVAQAALEAGAAIVNDVSGLADPEMAAVVAAAGAGLVISHLRGEPATMQRRIEFDDLLGEIGAELGDAAARARAAGVGDAQILLDPGVGFGKTAEQSAALVAASETLAARCARPVLIGASRKRFLAQLTGGKAVDDRGPASVVAALCAARHGAAVVRVHDVAATVEALRVWAGIEAELGVALRGHEGGGRR